MPDSSSRSAQNSAPLPNRNSTEAWTFFREWLKSPLSMAAFSPSGRQLARMMLEPLGKGDSRVVELGGGTGAFTRALLDHGIEAKQLMVLELNASLHEHLQQRFPDVAVVCGDARRLHALAEGSGFLSEGPADVVISGLGLLTMSRQVQREILEAAFSVLKADGKMVQFTYGPASPVGREVLEALNLKAERAGFALLNVPPASVYVLSRQRSKSIPARRVEPRKPTRV